jgi:NADPH:quinone reductase-like Zn-dependent oxidoreductase
MKAIVQHRYGNPSDVLRLEEIDDPTVEPGEILVRVAAAGVNPYDCYLVTGLPYIVRTQSGLRRPSKPVPGVDFAGTVAALGADVSSFAVGDEVFGMRAGAYGEYVRVRADRMVLPTPDRLTVEQAAATPMAGLTALQALRDKANVRAGHRVLVNGAAGGVGTFAVQIARAFGAHVTGVCSARNADLVRRLGAERAIDYATTDFTRETERYDAIIDTAGSQSLSRCRRVLAPGGVLVEVGGPSNGNWLGPLTFLAKVFAASKLARWNVKGMLTKNNPDDLAVLGQMIDAGFVTPVLDRSYVLADTAAALTYVSRRHARGKVVVTV